MGGLPRVLLVALVPLVACCGGGVVVQTALMALALAGAFWPKDSPDVETDP